MGHYRRLLIFILMFVTAVAAGCKDKASDLADESSGGSDPTTTPPSAPTVTTAAPLALNMWTIYDKQTYINNLTFTVTTPSGTVIDSAASTCAPSATNPVVTCTVTLEEGRLWASSLYYQYSRLPSACKLMVFEPYRYQASNAFLTPAGVGGYISAHMAYNGATVGVQCIDGNDAECWGGAAPQLVPGFPKNMELMYTPNEADMNTVTTDMVSMPSSWSNSAYADHTSLSNDSSGNPVYLQGNNRQAVSAGFTTANQANDYTATDLHSVADEYLGGTYIPYTLVCRDDYFDPATYQINLVVDELDTKSGTTPTLNHFWSWRDLP